LRIRADPTRLAALTARFADDPRVDVRELRAPFVAGDTDASTTLSSRQRLEHIRDDVAALRGFSGLVRRGGPSCCSSRRFPSASAFDHAIGHNGATARQRCAAP